MHIPLSEFEQRIDETILSRGLVYFNKGAVKACSRIAPEEYTATVEGSKSYTVHFTMKNQTITDHRCDCPYDLGPICKHMAALIFYLQGDAMKSEIPVRPKPKKKTTKSLYQQVKELVGQISHEELTTFLLKEVKRDQKLKNAFITEFGHLIEDQSKATYQRQIQGILKAAAGREGFIYWSQMKYVVNQIQPMIVNAEKAFDQFHYKKVFFFSSALLEEANKAFQYGDDSGGDLGYLVDASLEFLFRLSEAKLSDELRNQFFSYCTTSFEKGIFDGWDWHLDMLTLAKSLAKSQAEVDKIFQLLRSVIGEYHKERADEMTLDLLKQFGTEKEIVEFRDKHITNPNIRESEIQEAFDNGNHQAAVDLARAGIEYDKEERPGLVTKWTDWLLKVAQAQDDKEKIIEHARYLFIKNFHPKQDYYHVLKITLSADEWGPFLEELINDLEKRPHWSNVQLLRGIFIKEKMWDRLMAAVKTDRSLESIQDNEEFLAEDYSEELIELYRQGILEFLDVYTGRKYYKRACRYIRRMKKLGGRTQAEELADFLRQKYPQRVALLDELSRL